MKARKSILTQLLDKLRKSKPTPVRSARRKPSETKVRSSIEGLEGRIAPANLLSPSSIAYKDADGDMVTIKFSKPIFADVVDSLQLLIANNVLKFDTGNVAHDADTSQQLRLIDLTKLPFSLSGTGVNGVSITISAEAANGGNGVADVGAIKATGFTLGAVSIDGDLGQIDAGSASAALGISSLTVGSLGKRGIDTQIPVPSPTAQNPAPDLVSTIVGKLGSLNVLESVHGARINVVDGTNFLGQLSTLGTIGSVTIHGSLIGGTADDSGSIQSARDIGAIKIGTNLDDGVLGGVGKNSGRIIAGGKIASLTVSGNVLGDVGVNSGVVACNGTLGAVKIGNDLAGGNGENSGRVQSGGNLASITIGDDIAAGVGPGSGVVATSGTMGPVLVKGDIDGTIANAGAASGGLLAGKFGAITLNGSLFGGSTGQNGFIECTSDIGAVKILGGIDGGIGNGSGTIIAHGKIASLTVVGTIAGDVGLQSGSVISGFNPGLNGDIGAVIVGKLQGGNGDNSGAIIAGGKIASITLGTKLTLNDDVLAGGLGDYSGAISSQGTMGVVKINGNIHGGGGDFSGALLAYDRSDSTGELAGNIGAVTLTGNLIGGGGDHSGSIRAEGNLASATLGAITGGTGIDSGSLQTGLGLQKAGDSGAIKLIGGLMQTNVTPGAGSAAINIGGKLASLTVGGNVFAASVHLGDSVGAVVFGLDVDNTTVAARGQAIPTKTSDLAIASIVVKGNVTNSSFLAGYDINGNAVNPDAQIGAVTALKNWTASNLVAGIAVGTDTGFGNELDVKAPSLPDADAVGIVSKIASITIGGNVMGTGAGGDHFGFVAQLIGKLKVGTQTFAFDTKANGQLFELGGANNDVTAREIALV